MLRARRRALHRARARRRMMNAVPKATVVIANPTHYAVALAYEHGVSVAPTVVAKGVDALALRIRAIAEQAGVPVVENPAAARTLHALCEVDDQIPAETYHMVAAIIRYVMTRRTASASL
jgi:flagellar biosynthetic protein FlhB